MRIVKILRKIIKERRPLINNRSTQREMYLILKEFTLGKDASPLGTKTR